MLSANPLSEQIRCIAFPVWLPSRCLGLPTSIGLRVLMFLCPARGLPWGSWLAPVGNRISEYISFWFHPTGLYGCSFALLSPQYYSFSLGVMALAWCIVALFFISRKPLQAHSCDVQTQASQRKCCALVTGFYSEVPRRFLHTVFSLQPFDCLKVHFFEIKENGYNCAYPASLLRRPVTRTTPRSDD